MHPTKDLLFFYGLFSVCVCVCFLPCISGISVLYVVEKGLAIHISTQYLGIFWRFLHVPHAFRDLEKLTQLLELNVSSNMLTYLPSCLGRHPHLQVLRASCNLLQELPSFKNSSALKVVDITFTYNKLHYARKPRYVGDSGEGLRGYKSYLHALRKTSKSYLHCYG